MKTIALDLAVNRTGYAIFEGSVLVEYGYLEPDRYPGISKERYPQKTVKLSNSMAKKVVQLIAKNEVSPMQVVIEEINPNIRHGVKSIKGLAMIHGMILAQLPHRVLDNVIIITSSKWRSKLKIKKGDGWKSSSVAYANQQFNLNLSFDENDEADAINIGYSQLI